tara:strand:+ start:4915 stop:5094 length:180 start_codon:yes stop_codon:yes gene_type:complete
MHFQKEAIIFVGLGFASGAALWYAFWVKPNDQARAEIIECMDDDFSRASYDRCIAMRIP